MSNDERRPERCYDPRAALHLLLLSCLTLDSPALLLRHFQSLSSLVNADHSLVTDEEFPPLGPRRQASISSIPPGLQAGASRRSTPTLPPGLEESIQSRRGTPTVSSSLAQSIADDDKLVALQKPSALPVLEPIGSRPSSRASLRRAISSQIVPALPLRAATPAKIGSQPGTPARLMSRPASPLQTPKPVESHETPTKKGKGRAIGDHIGESLVRDAVTSTGEKLKGRMTDLAPPQSPVTAKKAVNTHVDAATESKPTDRDGTTGDVRRKHPGKLDITAAVKQQEELAAATSTSSAEAEVQSMAKRIASQTASASSVPESPVVASSPLSKPALRTIRLVQTPKAETPSPVVPAILPTPLSKKLPSRQPSVASMNVPGTPGSEHISTSDNISITSTTQSRANTPPPAVSKVGSAPVRTKTKSQLKKERQERAKALLEETQVEVATTAGAEEPAQEAIVARKKKTRKEKEIKPKPKPVEISPPEPTPVFTRPASPEPIKAEPSPPQPPRVVEPLSPPATPTLSPAQLLSELRASPEFAKSFDAFFRVPAVSNAKNASSIPAKDIDSHANWRTTEFGIKLGKEDVSKLLSGYAAVLGWGGSEDSVWSRAMITPGGAQLRALSEDLEQRFLELETHIQNLPEELRFRPTKPQNETRFPVMDLKALKKAFDSKGPRGANVMEQMVQDGSAMKKGAFLVDEVTKYINEFVMPPATPPPSAGRGAAQQAQPEQSQHHAGINRDMPVQSIEIAERQLQDAKRNVDEREGALRRAIKKNKKLLGLS